MSRAGRETESRQHRRRYTSSCVRKRESLLSHFLPETGSSICILQASHHFSSLYYRHARALQSLFQAVTLYILLPEYIYRQTGVGKLLPASVMNFIAKEQNT